jgi:hypothetical protein
MFTTSLLSRLVLLASICFALFSTALGQAADFPVYRDTGNPQKDAEDLAVRKQQWVAAHTEEYITMQPGLSEEGKATLRHTSIQRENDKRLARYKGQAQPRKIDFVQEADYRFANNDWLVANAITPQTLAQIEEQEAYNLRIEEEIRMEIGEGNTLEEEVVAKLLWIADNQEAYRMGIDKDEADKTIRKALYLKQKLDKK